MNALDYIALIIGWTVLASGGLAVTASILVAALNYVITRYTRGADIYRVAMIVCQERKEKREARDDN